MIITKDEPLVPLSSIAFVYDLLRQVKDGGVWVCANGFSVWKVHKKRKVAQVVGDDSKVNRLLKATFLQLGWSVLERELEADDKEVKNVC